MVWEPACGRSRLNSVLIAALAIASTGTLTGCAPSTRPSAQWIARATSGETRVAPSVGDPQVAQAGSTSAPSAVADASDGGTQAAQAGLVGEAQKVGTSKIQGAPSFPAPRAVRVGDTVEFYLYGDPATGHVWHYNNDKSVNSQILTVTPLGYRKYNGPQTGAPAAYVFRISPRQLGKATLMFDYVPPGGGAPEDTQELGVNFR